MKDLGINEWWKEDVPHYKHDCAKCKFLGNDIKKGGLVDLYYCPAPGRNSGSVIIRYGDDGPEYESADLSIAFRLAYNERDNYRHAIERGIGSSIISDEAILSSVKSNFKGL